MSADVLSHAIVVIGLCKYICEELFMVVMIDSCRAHGCCGYSIIAVDILLLFETNISLYGLNECLEL